MTSASVGSRTTTSYIHGDTCERFNSTNRKPTMGTSTIAVLVTIAFSIIGVLGDYFLKLASGREQPLRSTSFYIGFALYASTAFGWVFVMKHLKLATISVLYSVSLVLLLTAMGVVLFRESLNYLEMIGIVLAVASLVLLMRFAYLENASYDRPYASTATYLRARC